MKRRHSRLGPACLFLVLVLAACGIPIALAPDATPTADTQGIEEKLLRQIAQRICPHPDDPERIDPFERSFTFEDPRYSFTCYPATGHSITVTLRRFADPARARVAFASVPELGPVQELEGIPVSDWQEQHPSFPEGRTEYRVRLLQVGQWLISIRSFDDTHFLIAPDPAEASLAILEVVSEPGLAPSFEAPP